MPKKAEVTDDNRNISIYEMLGDYSRKLNRLANDARTLTTQVISYRGVHASDVMRAKVAEAKALYDRVTHLSQAAQHVARRASALAEHAVVNDPEKLAFKLRIADLESSANYAVQVALAALELARTSIK